MKENRKRIIGYRKEYAVGTILWWNKREIEVVCDDIPKRGVSDCASCVLYHTRTCATAVECRSYFRKDGIGVHFENVRREERI